MAALSRPHAGGHDVKEESRQRGEQTDTDRQAHSEPTARASTSPCKVSPDPSSTGMRSVLAAAWRQRCTACPAPARATRDGGVACGGATRVDQEGSRHRDARVDLAGSSPTQVPGCSLVHPKVTKTRLICAHASTRAKWLTRAVTGPVTGVVHLSTSSRISFIDRFVTQAPEYRVNLCFWTSSHCHRGVDRRLLKQANNGNLRQCHWRHSRAPRCGGQRIRVILPAPCHK